MPGQGMPMRGPGIPIALPPGMKIQPGQQPTPEQIEQIKQFQVEAKAKFEAQVAEQAQKEGVPVEQVMRRVQQQMQQRMQQQMQMQQRMMAQQQAQQQGGQQGGQQQGQQQGGQQGHGQQGQGQPQGQPQGQRPQGGPQPGVAQPITPGPPNPVAIAMANFLRAQDLKLRTCILNGDRKDMFRGMESQSQSGPPEVTWC